jgi:hypothetical protein
LQQKFRVCYASAWLDTPLLGIGFGNNFIDQLFLQGITQIWAFSVDLGNVDSTADSVSGSFYTKIILPTFSSSVIFGGIDTTKFSGPLAMNKIIPWSDMPDLTQRYAVFLYSMILSLTVSGIACTWHPLG